MKRWIPSIAAACLLALALSAAPAASARQNASAASANASASHTASSSGAPSSAPKAASSDDDSASLKAAEALFDLEAQAAGKELDERDVQQTAQQKSNPNQNLDARKTAAEKGDGSSSPSTGSKVFAAPQPATEKLFTQLGADFGNPVGSGIPVCSVRPGTSAAKAGLKAGDVVMTLGGKKVRSLAGLHSQLMQRRSSGTVTLGIVRHGAPMKVRLAIETPPASSQAASSSAQ